MVDTYLGGADMSESRRVRRAGVPVVGCSVPAELVQSRPQGFHERSIFQAQNHVCSCIRNHTDMSRTEYIVYEFFAYFLFPRMSRVNQ